MAIKNFPYVALFLGILFMLVVTFGGQINQATNNTLLPLLTLLLICEFAFFLTAIAAIMTVKQMLTVGYNLKMIIVAVLCAVSAITFLVKGFSFWPA